VVPDLGGHVPDEGEAGQGLGGHGPDRVDVDADVVVGVVGVVRDGVVEGVELHGHEPGVAGGHGVGALVGEPDVVGVGAGRQARRVGGGEEEGHAGALVVDAVLPRRVDDEGEARGEAGHLAGVLVPEAHRLGVVRRAARAVADAGQPVRRHLDPPAADVGVAFHPDVLEVFRAEAVVVEGQGGHWSCGEVVAAAHGGQEEVDDDTDGGASGCRRDRRDASHRAPAKPPPNKFRRTLEEVHCLKTRASSSA